MIDLKGWTHVHTWRESHGNGTQETYQREPVGSWARRVECVVFSFDRNGVCNHIRTERDRDYLMARDIRANPGRFTPIRRHVEPCYTAGSEDFLDATTDTRWRVFGAAGHGEWAFQLGDDD